MNGDHVTTLFELEPAPITPDGASVFETVHYRPEAVAVCLCGWYFTTSYAAQHHFGDETARTVVKMWAAEHVAGGTF